MHDLFIRVISHESPTMKHNEGARSQIRNLNPAEAPHLLKVTQLVQWRSRGSNPLRGDPNAWLSLIVLLQGDRGNEAVSVRELTQRPHSVGASCQWADDAVLQLAPLAGCCGHPSGQVQDRAKCPAQTEGPNGC